MSALGARLRASREARQMTPEAASHEAGIPLRYLQMLEEGRFPTVADPAYLTYFLRRYAIFLDLDPEASARDFLNETEPETSGRRVTTGPSAGSGRRGGVGWSLPPGWAAYGLYGLVLAVGLTGLFVFVRSQQEREARDHELAVASRPLQSAPARPRPVPEPVAKPEPAAKTAGDGLRVPVQTGGTGTRPTDSAPATSAPASPPEAPSSSAETPSSAAERPATAATSASDADGKDRTKPAEKEAASVAAAGRDVPEDESGATGTETPASPQAPAAPPSSEVVAEPEIAEAPATASAPEAPEKTRAEAVMGPFELRLTATSRQVWVWVSVDGGPREAVSLKRGETAVFHADRRYVLSVDDAGGIEGKLNGEPLPRFGASARARRNLVIPSAEFGGLRESSRG